MYATAKNSTIPVSNAKLSATSATALKKKDLQPLQNAQTSENVADRSTNKNNHVADVGDRIGGIHGQMSLDDEEVTLDC